MYRKIRFQSSEERRKAAEKIVFESEQISCTFGKLVTEVELSREIRSILPDLSELLKMGDTSLMTLELSVSMPLDSNYHSNSVIDFVVGEPR